MDRTIRVLVADDSRAVVIVVSKLLRQCGFSDIEHAYTAEEALEALCARRHPLIISDCYFGGMSGIQLLMAVRRNPLLFKTCFILMTAMRDKEVIDRAMHFQADSILMKPFTAAILEMKLSGLRKLKLQAEEVTPVEQPMAALLSTPATRALRAARAAIHVLEIASKQSHK
jgi:two-component system chemotaxis response regulator CheY